MSRRIRLAAVAGVTLVAAGGLTVPVSAAPDPLREFERLRQRQAAAWADENGAAFAATFTLDADMVTFNGDHLRTRAGIAAGMQRYFDEYIPPSEIRYLKEHVRFAEPGLAVIVRETCLVDAGQRDCRQGSTSVNTNVMRRHQGRWLQESFQNTRVAPLP